MAETIVDKECAKKASLFEDVQSIRRAILKCDLIAEYVYDIQKSLNELLKFILLNGELPQEFERVVESIDPDKLNWLIEVIESSDKESCDER